MKKLSISILTVLALTLPAVGHCADAAKTAGKAIKVADVFKNKDSLDKKQVTVKGKVVKVSANIMDRTWVHIQDGSGKAATKNNDLTVTTTEKAPAVGDVVTVTGTVAKNKDFGAGYFYTVIVEKATIK